MISKNHSGRAPGGAGLRISTHSFLSYDQAARRTPMSVSYMAASVKDGEGPLAVGLGHSPPAFKLGRLAELPKDPCEVAP